MEIVCPGLREIFPWMRSCVGGNELLLPISGRACRVGAVHRLAVAGPLVAEYQPEFIKLCGGSHEAIPIVMRDLVTKMSEQGPIGLAHLATTTFSLGVIRLGQIDSDDAVGVTRHHGGSAGRGCGNVRQKIKGQSIWIFRFGLSRKMKPKQSVEQSVFGDLYQPPVSQVLRLA